MEKENITAEVLQELDEKSRSLFLSTDGFCLAIKAEPYDMEIIQNALKYAVRSLRPVMQKPADYIRDSIKIYLFSPDLKTYKYFSAYSYFNVYMYDAIGKRFKSPYESETKDLAIIGIS